MDLTSPLPFRNRAIHGDVVAVKLLPKQQWKSLSNSLPSEDSKKTESADREPELEAGSSGSNAMPSGVVVGILDRPERLYVASFDVSV